VLRLSAALLATLAFLTACGKDIRTKDDVQQAIIARLQARSGLDLKEIDVTTTSVSFDQNMAYATVAFHPKGDADIHSGMVMKYTLQQRDGKWTVLKVGGSGLHEGSTGGALPPGHPQVDSGMGANPHGASQ
jgi:hypothetical protein